MAVLVTGSAGFIGAAVAHRLLESGQEVIGLDNLNDYYDPALKRARLDRLTSFARYHHYNVDLADRPSLRKLFEDRQPQRLIHLAAQAGVRYSIENPDAYVQSNLVGFANLLEMVKDLALEHFVFASTSSVYGSNTSMPYAVRDPVDHPLSFYAATKRANELMAHAYSHLFRLPTTGLRFFTVYGPWGRPDMALFKFTSRMLAGEPIELFNAGQHTRDFTYIDDIVEGVMRCLDSPATPDGSWDPANPDPSRSSAPFRIFNIGSNAPCELLRYVEVLEDSLGVTAERIELPLQAGDVADTWADVSELVDEFDYSPSTSIEVGVSRFVAWYLDYYGSNISHNVK